MRLALALVLLLVGAALLSYSLFFREPVEAGWTEIEAQTAEASCAGEFTFLYPLGTTASPAAEQRALVTLYSDACVDAYRLFTDDLEFDGLANVRSLNLHPNEELTLDPALYAALEQIARSGDRSLYLAPIFEVYGGIFTCSDPSQTADYDPRRSDALRAWCAAVCSYANDPAQVRVELLGENRAALRVSEEYLAFAREEEIGSFIDFAWMKNAFVADYLAGRLTDAGYAIGTLSSADGFIRNLDVDADAGYALNIFAHDGQSARIAAVLHYRGARAFVCLRDFSLGPADASRCALLPDDSYATPYLDPADGLCKSSVRSLTAYSETAGCAEIALRLAPVYIAEELDGEALAALAREGIQSVYLDGAELVCTDPSAEFADPSGTPMAPHEP